MRRLHTDLMDKLSLIWMKYEEFQPKNSQKELQVESPSSAENSSHTSYKNDNKQVNTNLIEHN